MKKLLAITLFLAACGSNKYSHTKGTPKKLVTIEIAEFDFPEDMDWNTAKSTCSELGKGWRLPNVDELDEILQNSDGHSGFQSGYYWSSTVMESGSAYYFDFVSGGASYDSKGLKCHVRAVRSL